MRAFITGITGFIGSHVAELLLRNGDEVIGAARGTWHSNVPQRLVDSVKLHQWDICNPAKVSLIHELREFQPTAIFHFAAISIPALCGEDSPTDHALDVNVNGTANLLDVAAQIPGSPRVVFSSTCHVYGPVDEASARVSEEAKLDPISAYGQTKLLCEQEIQRRVTASELEATVARGFHHIGPRQPSGLMLTDWLEQIQNAKTDRIHVRSTNSFLDLIDVRDAAVAYRLLAMDGKIGETYNLGSGKVSNSGDVLQALLALADRQFEVVASSNAERWNSIADISKLSSVGWAPRIEYSQTIRDMIAR